jgi:hypothetical protein
MLASASCAREPRREARSIGALEANALVYGRPRPAAETSTRTYRALARNALGSRCRMFPSDSELYDRRARRCGAATAAVLGVSRLLLEVAAGPDLLHPVLIDGRVRWLDLPPDEGCPP